jgi:hypothetical protein
VCLQRVALSYVYASIKVGLGELPGRLHIFLMPSISDAPLYVCMYVCMYEAVNGKDVTFNHIIKCQERDTIKYNNDAMVYCALAIDRLL